MDFSLNRFCRMLGGKKRLLMGIGIWRISDF
jgi:hypothetical protein